MFEPAEIGSKLSDKAFGKVKSSLRLDLVDLQRRCREAHDFPVLILVAGVPGAGLADTVNLLNTWMDPRWILTTAFDTPTEEERERPTFWRYWRALPAAGTIGLYLNGWYEDPMSDIQTGKISKTDYKVKLRRIANFERTLSDDGALILKFWLHLSKKEERERGPERRNDALVGLRPSDAALTLPRRYDDLVKAGADAIRATMHADAPWHIVEGSDDNYRRATVLGLLRDALARHLKVRRKQAKAAKADKKHKRKNRKHAAPPLITAKAKDRNVLDAVKMHEMSRENYQHRFHKLQQTLYDAHKVARDAGLSSVLVFEGWDAAGKGGAIRRLSYALNARNYKIIPIAAPNDEERAHHYLWRFWRSLERAGRMTIFDRSWYGRVLVERVEGLISPEAWNRAYGEINDFERALVDDGDIVMKFWLHISRKEQLKRFEAREETSYKRWKLTDDDWRNRARWDDYESAVNDMVAYTSTDAAPWHLIGANNKHFARIQVLETVAEALTGALKARGLSTRRRS